MARGFSKTIISGHVGDEPEVRFTNSGKAVAVFSIAVTEVWKHKDGERKERTQWHRVKAYGRTAEIARDYVHRGSLVLVEAKYRSEKYVDKDGVDRYSDEFIVDELHLQDRAKGDAPDEADSAPPAGEGEG